ncbi:MAG: hypothetical protein M3R27_16535 [Bacteroidota bacterium]|nr:hypothetical protein [Bacteroidota bacterium]
MNYNIFTYGIYLLITIILVLYVGAVLFKNGRPFLINTFSGDVTLADALNKVLLAGYYLVNTGYVILALKVWETVESPLQMYNVLSYKTGCITIALGCMHLFNVFCLLAIGKNRKQKINHNN